MKYKTKFFFKLFFIFLFILLPPVLAENLTSERVELVSNTWLKGTVVVVYGNQYGTGFWINPTHVVTAAHVVNFDSSAQVSIIRGNVRSEGVVVALDRQTDIVVIYVQNADMFDKHVFPIARTLPDIGSTIYVVGYPSELLQIMGSLETLSEHPRVLTSRLTWSANGLIELGGITDAGNSGGPVLNSVGEVIGIVSFALRGSAGTLYFASSAGNLKQLCEEHNIVYVEGVAGTILQPVVDNPVATAAVVNVLMDVVFIVLGISLGTLIATKRGRK